MSNRFVITNNAGEVSVLDTQNEVTDENLLVFNIECCNKEDGDYIAEELSDLVRTLNEQNEIIKEHNLCFP